MNLANGFRIASVKACVLAALLSASTGCGESTRSGTGRADAMTRPGSSNSLLMQVRAAGRVGNELDVQPLRDPQVEDLRTLAAAAEQRGDFAGASQILLKALQVTPNDPDLLQWQAEMALAMRNWSLAEQLATQSYEKGPKLGGLCRRNWTTIRVAAEARGNAAVAGAAQQRIPACTVAPPTRM